MQHRNQGSMVEIKVPEILPSGLNFPSEAHRILMSLKLSH